MLISGIFGLNWKILIVLDSPVIKDSYRSLLRTGWLFWCNKRCDPLPFDMGPYPERKDISLSFFEINQKKFHHFLKHLHQHYTHRDQVWNKTTNHQTKPQLKWGLYGAWNIQTCLYLALYRIRHVNSEF